jgi:hypothetical protein
MYHLLFAALLLVSSRAPATEEALRGSVDEYWDAVQKGDLASVLHLVHPDDWNSFIKSPQVHFKSWRYLKMTRQNDAVMHVAVEIERVASSVSAPVKVRQKWEMVEGSWKLRVQSPEKDKAEFMESGIVRRPLEPVLAVVPGKVRIYKVNHAQTGNLLIRNGLEHQANLLSVKLDSEKFEILRQPDEVPPKAEAKIVIRYIGSEKEDNLTSELTLTLHQGGASNDFTVQIVYNYTDAASEWLFKNAIKEMKRLQNEPKDSTPASPPPPPVPPPA